MPAAQVQNAGGDQLHGLRIVVGYEDVERPAQRARKQAHIE